VELEEAAGRQRRSRPIAYTRGPGRVGPLRRSIALAPEEVREIDALHAGLLEQLRLAVAVFALDDQEAARQLVRRKEALRSTEQEAAGRLTQGGGAAARLLLDAVRDLRRVGAHLASAAGAAGRAVAEPPRPALRGARRGRPSE